MEPKTIGNNLLGTNLRLIHPIQSISEVPIYYFSASGNTLYCAQLVQKGIQSRSLTTTLNEIKSISQFEFPRDDITSFGIAYPVYEFMVPRIILSWIKHLPPSLKPIPVFLISTCGGVSADSAAIAQRFLHKKNYQVIGILELPTPTGEPFLSNEHYNAQWHPEILARSYFFGQIIGQHLLRNNWKMVDLRFSKYRFSKLTEYCYQYISQHKPTMKGMIKHQPKLCTQCGVCIRLCPMQTMKFHPNGFGVIINEENCMFCGTCLRNCPTHALCISYRTKVIVPKKTVAPMSRPGYIMPEKYQFPNNWHPNLSAIRLLIEMVKKN